MLPPPNFRAQAVFENIKMRTYDAIYAAWVDDRKNTEFCYFSYSFSINRDVVRFMVTHSEPMPQPWIILCFQWSLLLWTFTWQLEEQFWMAAIMMTVLQHGCSNVEEIGCSTRSRLIFSRLLQSQKKKKCSVFKVFKKVFTALQNIKQVAF